MNTGIKCVKSASSVWHEKPITVSNNMFFRIKQTTPCTIAHDSPETSFMLPKIYAKKKIRTVSSLYGGAKLRWCRLKLATYFWRITRCTRQQANHNAGPRDASSRKIDNIALHEGIPVASIARDDPFPLPGMHRDHNALPSQTDRRTLTS